MPADRWPAEAESISRVFGAPARIVDSASAEAREAAPDGPPGYGPPGGRPPGHSTPFLVSVGVTLPIVGIIGFLMTYPVVRRLKALELAATRIAADDLQARAPALARSRAI